jgi:hypothetical protein
MKYLEYLQKEDTPSPVPTSNWSDVIFLSDNYGTPNSTNRKIKVRIRTRGGVERFQLNRVRNFTMLHFMMEDSAPSPPPPLFVNSRELPCYVNVPTSLLESPPQDNQIVSQPPTVGSVYRRKTNGRNLTDCKRQIFKKSK